MTDPHGIDVAALAAEIAARLRALPNRTVPIVRRVRREFSQRLAHAPAQVVLTLALHLLDHPDFESRFVAYELVTLISREIRGGSNHASTPGYG
jgi:hypothetical protein